MRDHAGILASREPGVGSGKNFSPNNWGNFTCFDGQNCKFAHNCGGYCPKARMLADNKAYATFPNSRIVMPRGGPADTKVLYVPVHTYEEIFSGFKKVNLGNIRVQYPQGVVVIKK